MASLDGLIFGIKFIYVGFTPGKNQSQFTFRYSFLGHAADADS